MSTRHIIKLINELYIIINFYVIWIIVASFHMLFQYHVSLRTSVSFGPNYSLFLVYSSIVRENCGPQRLNKISQLFLIRYSSCGARETLIDQKLK